MQEVDLTGCSSDSANDKAQHGGNATLRGIMQNSGSLSSVSTSPSFSPRGNHISLVWAHLVGSLHGWQVLCSPAFRLTDTRGANSPRRQGGQVEGAWRFVSVMKKVSSPLVFVCSITIGSPITHVVLWELEKWTAVSYYQAVFYLPNLCKHYAMINNSSVSQRTPMPKKLGDSRWHFSSDAFKFTSSTPQSSHFLHWHQWFPYCSKCLPENEVWSCRSGEGQ